MKDVKLPKSLTKKRSYRLAREEADHRRYLEQEKIRKEKEKRESLLGEIHNKNTADKIRKYIEDCSEAYSTGKLQKRTSLIGNNGR